MRYFIGFLVTIGLVVLIFVLLLRGGGSSPTQQALNLTSFASNSSSQASLLIDGPVNADSLHRQLQIDVTENSVSMTTYQGYQQTVLNTEMNPNNRDAYASFLRSLQVAGFTHGNVDKTVSDERGNCPLSDRYVLSFTADNKQQSRFWTTGCGGGTFRGNFNVVKALFSRQIPDYDKQINNLGF